MANTAFDTLEAARLLEAADIQGEKADAIVKVVNQSASQMVTVERFDIAVAELHARIDTVHAELSARIDSLQADSAARIDSLGPALKAENLRTQLIVVGIFLAFNALMATTFGILLANGAFGTVTIGAT